MKRKNNVICCFMILLVFIGCLNHPLLANDMSRYDCINLSNGYTPQVAWKKTFDGLNHDFLISLHHNNLSGFDFFINSWEVDTKQVYMFRTSDHGILELKKPLFDDLFDDKTILKAEQTDDFGYILSGYALNIREGRDVALLAKVNEQGNREWYDTYLVPDSDSYIESTIQTSDGGYISVGHASKHENDLYWSYLTLRKTDENGDTEWVKTLDKGPLTLFGLLVIEADEGGYFIIAEQSEQFQDQVTLLIKTDASGEPLWEKELLQDSYYEVKPTIEKRSDEYVFHGFSYITEQSSLNTVLITFDEQGTILFSKVITQSSPYHYGIGYSNVPTADEGYVFSGSIGNTMLLMKVDEQGEREWEKTYPDGYVAFDLLRSDDGGYIILGQSWADTEDVVLLKLDNSLQNPPLILQGETSAEPGINYTYVMTAVDSDGDDIFFTIDWGDESEIQTIGPYPSGAEVSVNHSWNEEGEYILRARVVDSYQQESDWSSLQISIPKQKGIHFIMQSLLDVFQQGFPLIYRVINHIINL